MEIMAVLLTPPLKLSRLLRLFAIPYFQFVP